MRSMHFTILSPPDVLKRDVECVRIAKYSGEEPVAIKVSPTGLPGMVFSQYNGHAALEQIVTRSGRVSGPPPLFLYGPVVEPSVMQYKGVAGTTIQVIFKPHALKTLLGINAATLAPGWAAPRDFGAENLASQLLEAGSGQERLTFLVRYLVSRLQQEQPRDTLVEESLRLIQANIGVLHVKDVLDALSISERQFERRFTQTVGLTPQMYLRVKRFNEALRLLKSGHCERLTDIASALHFADQSHFIRDIKAFSGITPRSLVQKADDFYHELTGYSFV